jgi:hypothetical protein
MTIDIHQMYINARIQHFIDNTLYFDFKKITVERVISDSVFIVFGYF